MVYLRVRSFESDHICAGELLYFGCFKQNSPLSLSLSASRTYIFLTSLFGVYPESHSVFLVLKHVYEGFHVCVARPPIAQLFCHCAVSTAASLVYRVFVV